jgi:Mg/Co/Ni transporter MgtE
MMRWVKRTLVEMLVGAVVGFVVWCIAGKSLTSMMFGSLGGSFSCQTDVQLALTKFLSMQLYSALGGALILAVASGLIRRALQKRNTQTRSPTPAQSGAS